MKLTVTGLSHRTAPIELRERFAERTRDLPTALAELKKLDGVEEACIISTCNRVEFYLSGSAEPPQLLRVLRSYLQSFSGINPNELDPHLYQHESSDGLRHLFRVAASLDSMVLGEPQILGQVKEAFRAASEHGSAGPVLSSAFQKAFAVAKRVRTDTGIAENAVSMSFAAVELGRQIFTSLEGKQVLVIGAGKMSALAAKHLKAYGAAEIRVANRSIQAAQRLAEEIGGLASSLSDLPILLTQSDIVISSTAAPGFVVDKPLMQRVVRERRYRPILFVDIAVPRDIDPSVADLDNVYVFDVDDLQNVLENNRKAREKEAQAAEDIVQGEVHSYARWSRSRQVVPVIKALRAHAVSIAEGEAARTLQHVKAPDKKVEASIKAMGQAIVNKLLHPVLTRLKEEGASGDPQKLVDSLIALFDLDPAVLYESEDPRKPEGEEPGANVVQMKRES